MSSSDSFLPLSGIQHFVFCRRQWALIHIEQLWEENALTAEGKIQHEKTHDEFRLESRGNLVISRGIRVLSNRLRLQGVCDTVEFRQEPAGVPLKGRDGLWQAYPVEYKHGQPGNHSLADSLQLCAQAICLEEMLVGDVLKGALFYHGSRVRKELEFNQDLRVMTQRVAEEMNQLFMKGYTPQVKPRSGCKRCSLKEICLPDLIESASADAYVRQAVLEAQSE